MNSTTVILVDLIGGSVSGSHFFAKLGPDSTTVKIDWDVSQQIDTQKFEAEFVARSGENGSVDLGNGKKLDWSFKSAE